MPYSQSIPITSLDEYGLIYDRPAPSLPNNAYSDGINVRFRDGAIKKMEGELNIFPNLFDDATNVIDGRPANFDGSSIKYIAYWANPNIIAFNEGYYLVITEEDRLGIPKDIAYLVSVDGTEKVEKGEFTAATEGQWHHTLFQGGFALIINNNIDKPHYILDVDGNTDINTVPSFLELPGWDSYYLENISLTDRFDPPIPDEDGNIIGDTYIFSLGKRINFDEFYIKVYRENSLNPGTYVNLSAVGDTGVAGTANNEGFSPPDYTTISTSPYQGTDEYEIFYDSSQGVTVLNLPENLSISGLDTVTVKVISRNPVTVTAGVVRSFGDFLIAGDLVERSIVPPYDILRSLPGVIRTSDVAPPGAIPNNWNPFSSGVSTADEYVVSDVSPVTDMVEMQGNMYIYTQSTISVLRRTGNVNSPIQVSTLTDSHGCQSLNCVVEFDGKHCVLGSKDVYIFSGNPSGIESIADGRVRKYLFNTINPLGNDRAFLLDNKTREEIWIVYPTTASSTAYCDEAMIWSYSNNTWSRRSIRGAVSGTVGPIPGGGLPRSDILIDNVTGDSGVTHVGAYEVRVIGLDPSVTFPADSDPVYTGVGSAAVYVDGGATLFYTSVIVDPVLTLTGPENLSVDITIPSGADSIISTQEIWDTITPYIEAHSGWSMDEGNFPSGYTQLTGTIQLVAADTLRTVESVPFDLSLKTANSFTSLSAINMEDSSVDPDVHGVVPTITNDYRGSEVRRAVPTIFGVEITNPNVIGGVEMIFAVIGEDGDYNPATHSGTNNGISYNDAQAVVYLVDKINSSTSEVVAVAGATVGSLTISNASSSVVAGILSEVRANTSAEDAAWILERYNSAVAGSIYLNPFSDLIDVDNFGVASNAPAIAGSLDTQHTPDGTRTPDRSGDSTVATLTASIDTDRNFDLIRPWPKDEINPNLDFPILATKAFITSGSSRVDMTKIIAADLGWSVPTFSATPREEVDVVGKLVPDIVDNDAPVGYESYIERKQLNISPDQDTETIHQVSAWVSGSTTPYIGSDVLYNRLQLRYSGSDNPGRDVDLETTVGNKKNELFVGEGNKFDTRLHGRYLNFRITDEVQDANGVVQATTANTKKTTSTTFSQESLWEISGLQPEVNKGGRR